MTPSREYVALKALTQPPERSRPGDMWLLRSVGIVKVFNGHKRGTRRGLAHNDFHLYHWGKPSLRSAPCEWRDDDPNCGGFDDPANGGRCLGTREWEYIGNIFELLPFDALAGSEIKGCKEQ